MTWELSSNSNDLWSFRKSKRIKRDGEKTACYGMQMIWMLMGLMASLEQSGLSFYDCNFLTRKIQRNALRTWLCVLWTVHFWAISRLSEVVSGLPRPFPCSTVLAAPPGALRLVVYGGDKYPSLLMFFTLLHSLMECPKPKKIYL